MNRKVPTGFALAIIIFCSALLLVSVEHLSSYRNQVNLNPDTGNPFFVFEDGFFETDIKVADSVKVFGLQKSDDTEILLGEMVWEEGTWQSPSPEDVFVLNSIEARAFSDGGEIVWRDFLDLSGPDEIYTKVWGSDSENIQEAKIGGTIRFEEARLTFQSVLEDSRCPEDAQCVHSGDFDVHVFVDTPDMNDVFVLSLGDKPSDFGDYLIDIIEVEPKRTLDSLDINKKDYLVTFRFLFDISSVLNLD